MRVPSRAAAVLRHRKLHELLLDVFLPLAFAFVAWLAFQVFNSYHMLDVGLANCDCNSNSNADFGLLKRFRASSVNGNIVGSGGIVGPCDNSEMWSDPAFQARRQSICTGSADVQVPKFIMFVTDALRESSAESILQHYSKNSRAFAVSVPGAKWSHAIYSSYFTGQHNSNFLDLSLTTVDNFFDALWRAGHRTRWQGPIIPIMRLFAPIDSLKDVYFDQWNMTDAIDTLHGSEGELSQTGEWSDDDICAALEKVDIEVDREFGWPRAHASIFFGNSTRERRQHAFSILDEVKTAGQSLITYTTTLDSWQHSGPAKEECSWPRLVPRINDDLMLLKDWVDSNPEYLLILLSDHGKNVREPDFVLHGESDQGNDGFFLRYSKRLFETDQPGVGLTPLPKMVISDVGPTIATSVVGLDVPLTSIGIPLFALEQRDLTPSESLLLARVVMQLMRSASLRGVASSTVAEARLLVQQLFGSHADPLEVASSPEWRAAINLTAFSLRAAVMQNTSSMLSVVLPICMLLIFLGELPLLVVFWNSERISRKTDVLAARLAMLAFIGGSLYCTVELGFTWHEFKSYHQRGLEHFAAFVVASVALLALIPSLPTGDHAHQRKCLGLALGLSLVVLVGSWLPSMGPTFSTVASTFLSVVTAGIVAWFYWDSVSWMIPRASVALLGAAAILSDVASWTPDWFWFNDDRQIVGGMNIVAFCAVTLEILSVLVCFVQHNWQAATAQVLTAFCAAMLTHTWMVNSIHFGARIVIICAAMSFLACSRTYAALFASRPRLAPVAGSHAFAVALFFGCNLAPLDLNVQADFSGWGLRDYDKHIYLNAWSMACSKFGLVVPLLVFATMHQERVFHAALTADEPRARNSWNSALRSVAAALYLRPLLLQMMLHSVVSVAALQILFASLSQAHRPEDPFVVAFMLGLAGFLASLISASYKLTSSDEVRGGMLGAI